MSLPRMRVESNLRQFECLGEELPTCDPSARFRTIDGTCNNLDRVLVGRSETRFRRLSPPLYEDGSFTLLATTTVNSIQGSVLCIKSVTFLLNFERKVRTVSWILALLNLISSINI